MTKKLVPNIIKFVGHITHHRNRVFKLGWLLKNNVKKPSHLFWILLAHDIEKYVYFPWLWKYYSHNTKDDIQARKLYDGMNRVGSWIQNAIFFVLGTSPIEQSTIKQIEHIADIVDRHCDPVALEEFNLKKQRPFSDFLTPEETFVAELLQFSWSDV